MILGTHNSWSYLPPSKWWMKPFNFMSKCQNCSIEEQYEKYNVRCFDLRIRFKKGLPVICHGMAEYKRSYEELLEDLNWLHAKGDITIRLALELRGVSKKKWKEQKQHFNTFYLTILKIFYPNFSFILGRSLPDWEKVIKDIPEGNVVEDYASISNPRYIDDWIPIIYALWHNKFAIQAYRGNGILLLDFIDKQ